MDEASLFNSPGGELSRAVLGAVVRHRYWSKIVLVPGHDCMWWIGAVSGRGHGRFWIQTLPDGRDHVMIAHRYGYALAYGLEALQEAPGLAHSCDNPLCQNADHLSPSSNFDNTWEWSVRRHRVHGPLRDLRGAYGRALAVRDALRAGLDPWPVLQAGDVDLDQPALFGPDDWG